MTVRLGILSPTTARGGSEEYLLALASWARDRGCEVTVGLPDVAGLGSVRAELKAAGVDLATLRPPAEPGLGDGYMAARADAARLLRDRMPDRLVVVLPYTTAGTALVDAAAQCGLPAAVVFQLAHPFRFQGLERQILSWARRRRQAWIAVSDHNRHLLCSALGWCEDSIAVVRNAPLRPMPMPQSQAGDGARASVRQELGLPPHARLVLTVARLDPQKAPDVLLEAAVAVAATDPSVHFAWVGDGPLEASFAAQVRDRGMECRMHRLGRRSDVDRWLAAADAFALASRYEGCPFAALEAMRAGVPAVLSDIEPHREIATEGREALIVPVDDADALARAIRAVLGDKGLSARLAAAARRRVSSASATSGFELVLKMLEAEVAARPRRAPWPLSQSPQTRVAVFGTGDGGLRALEELMPFADVVAFLDSRLERQGTSLEGRPVLAPSAARTLDVERVVLASCWHVEMAATLRAAGFAEDRIEVFPQLRLLPIDTERIPWDARHDVQRSWSWLRAADASAGAEDGGPTSRNPPSAPPSPPAAPRNTDTP